MGSSHTTPASLVDSSRVTIGDQLRQSRTCTCSDMNQAEVILYTCYILYHPTHPRRGTFHLDAKLHFEYQNRDLYPGRRWPKWCQTVIRHRVYTTTALLTAIWCIVHSLTSRGPSHTARLFPVGESDSENSEAVGSGKC